MYPKLKINVYFIFLNIGDLTFGITLVHWCSPTRLHGINPDHSFTLCHCETSNLTYVNNIVFLDLLQLFKKFNISEVVYNKYRKCLEFFI
jgi:hypothetical protein